MMPTPFSRKLPPLSGSSFVAVQEPPALFSTSSAARLFLVLASLLWLGVSLASGQDFRITSASLGPGNQPLVQFQAATDSYYLLLRGTSLTDLSTPAALTLATSTNGQLTDATPLDASHVTFLRVQRVLLTQPLDTDRDGIDDVYELRHAADLNPLDTADADRTAPTGRTWLNQYLYETFPLTKIAESSPANGESGVAVTRETIFRFNVPLSSDTVLNTNNLCACFGGRQILSRIELSTDRKKVTLFYQEPLPASARVRVTFSGTNLTDSLGRALDLDGDGQPGGNAIVDFDTLSITPVAGTAVIGHIFASLQVPVVSTNSTTNFVDHPLAGVLVSVIGAEQEIFTTTDAQGFFRLTNCPAGRFFVSIDGRTSPESNWPNGDYYPLVGKPWEAVAGRTNNLAGGNGLIYLPLVQAGTLQPVNPTADTTIGFPANIIAANPAWAGVSVTIPTNALFSDNGTRGGRVGLAPVPSDRLPERLPAGIVHALDISIQTDGPQNVDRPLPVRFPNLPDPQTGLKLPPGAKSALMSYNHDTGRWEVQGPMTVTADGNYVETDPGVGVRQPGWHGTMGGTQGGGGPMTGPGTGPSPYNDDIDGDGIPNGQDDDVDGDGVKNGDDPDIDGDGIPNGQDSDMDGDGIPNNQDNDMDGDGIPNDQDPDPDGPDGQCNVSIVGASQGNCGDTLTLSSTVSANGGTYGWSVVGAAGELVFPLPGQSAPNANVKLKGVGQVIVHLTYRPPGSNSADTQCGAESVITISMGQPTIRIVSVSGSATWTGDSSKQTFISTDTITARAELTGACQPKVRWTVIGKSGTPQPAFEAVSIGDENFSFKPKDLQTGFGTFAQYREAVWTGGSTSANEPIEFDLKAEILDDFNNPVAESLLSNLSVGRLVQDDIDRIRQEYVDYGFSLPTRAQVVPKNPTALFPTSRFSVSGNAGGGNYPFVVDAGFSGLAESVYSQAFPSGGGRLTITSYYRNPRAQGSINPGVSESYHVRGRAVDIAINATGLNPIDLYRAATAVTALEVLLEEGTAQLLPQNWKPPGSTPDANNDLGGGVLWNDTNGNGIPDLLVTSQGAPLPPAGQVFTLKGESYIVNSGRTTLLFRDSAASLRNLDALFSQATHVHAAK